MYTIGPLTTSNFMGWVVKGKESPSRWGPTLQNFSKIIPVFLGENLSFFRILRSELIVKKLNQSKVSNTGSVHYTLQADIQLTGIQL